VQIVPFHPHLTSPIKGEEYPERRSVMLIRVFLDSQIVQSRDRDSTASFRKMIKYKIHWIPAFAGMDYYNLSFILCFLRRMVSPMGYAYSLHLAAFEVVEDEVGHYHRLAFLERRPCR
jgi:hypothetical protein